MDAHCALTAVYPLTHFSSLILKNFFLTEIQYDVIKLLKDSVLLTKNRD